MSGAVGVEQLEQLEPELEQLEPELEQLEPELEQLEPELERLLERVLERNRRACKRIERRWGLVLALMLDGLAL